MKCRDEIPLNQWFLVEALSPPLYLCYLTLRWLIKEVKVILGNSRKKRSKNHFVSLLVSGVLLGAGVGVPNQIFQIQPAEAARPRVAAISLNASSCGIVTGVGDVTGTLSWKYS